MQDPKPFRFLRLLAICADFFIFWLSMLILSALPRLATSRACVAVLPFGVICGFGFLFCRDYLFGGRSPGKRLTGLTVVDRSTGAPANGRQLMVKSLLSYFCAIDGLVLLFSGKSLGERASGTAVVRGTASSPISKKRFLKVAAVAAVIAFLFLGIITFALGIATKQESYAVAYDYLCANVEGLDEDDLFLNSFSGNTTTNAAGEWTTSHTYTFGFSYEITCHPDDSGQWYVCTECTDLE